MIGTIFVFVVGVVAGAAGRNQIAEAVKFVGDSAYQILKSDKNDTDKPSK